MIYPRVPTVIWNNDANWVVLLNQFPQLEAIYIQSGTLPYQQRRHLPHTEQEHQSISTILDGVPTLKRICYFYMLEGPDADKHGLGEGKGRIVAAEHTTDGFFTQVNEEMDRYSRESDINGLAKAMHVHAGGTWLL